MMLLTRAKTGASGNAATNSVTKPNCDTATPTQIHSSVTSIKHNINLWQKDMSGSAHLQILLYQQNDRQKAINDPEGRQKLDRLQNATKLAGMTCHLINKAVMKQKCIEALSQLIAEQLIGPSNSRATG